VLRGRLRAGGARVLITYDDADTGLSYEFIGRGATEPEPEMAAPYAGRGFDGEKFAGGLNPLEWWAQITDAQDLPTLRKRSAKLFTKNVYARGLVRRMVTNEINIGLNPDPSPAHEILGMTEDEALDWAENVQTQWDIYARTAAACCVDGTLTFGQMQAAARLEALVDGDALVVVRMDRRTQLPRVRVYRGALIMDPLDKQGRDIRDGIEYDNAGTIIAHWVDTTAGVKRIPAKGATTGRPMSWLIYGTDRRSGEDRGTPLLSLFIQALEDLDQYRDAATRKAVINSFYAMYIKKTEDKPGTRPISTGAVRRDSYPIDGAAGGLQPPSTRTVAQQVPGVVIEELQVGEEPVQMGQAGTDLAFPEFERALVQTFAWACEYPPEILMLSFSSNYSASQAALNELKGYLQRTWADFGASMCRPVYVYWLTNMVLTRRISAPGFLRAWRTPRRVMEFGAWCRVDWFGAVKPSMDAVKHTKAAKGALDLGLTTHTREARAYNGSSYMQNIRKQKRELERMAELAELRRQVAGTPEEPGTDTDTDAADAVAEAMENLVDEIDDLKRITGAR
jgi:lambda family phage portal protein